MNDIFRRYQEEKPSANTRRLQTVDKPIYKQKRVWDILSD